MPEYWEYTSSTYIRRHYKPCVEMFTRALPEYQDELKVELEIRLTFSPV
jgi:hypothetical protein